MDSENTTLYIGKTYIVRKERFSRLCADIIIGKHRITFWFAVDISQEECLCVGRADAFVTAFLPMAMRGGHDIVCEDPVSERLQYQLNNYLIPTLASVGSLYHRIHIRAAYTKECYHSRKVVGTGFSGGVDSLYTILRHGVDSVYPLDYIAVFNTGNIEEGFGKTQFWESCKAAACFAEEQHLQMVYVDTNFSEALPEYYYQVFSFRNLSCALALQGLFSVYLLSEGGTGGASGFRLDLNNCWRYDLLSINCTATETISFYLSGAEKKRWEKIEALANWAPSYKWLHPCTAGIVGQRNCGHCKKCIHDQAVLYALGRLERYSQVFDIQDYQKNLSRRLAFIFSRESGYVNEETKLLLKEKNVPIPKETYLYAEQFRRAMGNLKASKGER